MKASSQAYRINITHPVYCEVLTDTELGTTYGTVKTFGEAQTMEVTAVVAEGTLYGNGAIVDSTSKITGLTAAFTATKIPVEVQADIYNYEVTGGVIQQKAGTIAKNIAVGYEVEQTSGKSEYVWLLKGRPAPMNQSVSQSETSVNYSTDTITINFMARKSDGMLRFFADASNEEFTAAQAEKWFNEGPVSPVTE